MTEEQVLNLLSQVCGEPAIKQDVDMELLESGILDSIAFVELLEKLEDEAGIEIQPTLVARDNWQTPRKIIALIAEYMDFLSKDV